MTKIDESKAELLASVVATSGMTIGAAGDSLGWDSTSTYRISRTTEYRQALAAKVLEIADAIVAQNIAAHSAAMAVLVELMATGDDNTRLNASKTILASFGKIHELAAKQLIESAEAIARRKRSEALDDLQYFAPRSPQPAA